MHFGLEMVDKKKKKKKQLQKKNQVSFTLSAVYVF